MYLLRAMPPCITLVPITSFDQRKREALLPRLLRSSNPLPSSTLVSLTHPGGNGGLGLRELGSIAPRRAGLRQLLLPETCKGSLPFVLDRATAFGMLVASGILWRKPAHPLLRGHIIAPGGAMTQRERYNIGKYAAH